MGVEFVFIADLDDPDVIDVAAGLELLGAEYRWLKLAMDHTEYRISVSSESCDFEAGGVALTSEEIRSARVVVFRRWRSSPPAPIVRAQLMSDPSHFAEREWDTAVGTVLQSWYGAGGATWSRPALEPPTKLMQLRKCEWAGLPVPPYRVSNVPRLFEADLVTKALSVDQSVGDGRFVTRSVVDDGLERMFANTQPCPVLLQKLVSVRLELRVLYSFGCVAAVAQKREDGSGGVDIRLANVVRRPWTVDDEIRSMMQTIARVLALNLFSVDILIDTAGRYWLIDINHDGLVGPVDDESRTLRSALLEGISGHATELTDGG